MSENRNGPHGKKGKQINELLALIRKLLRLLRKGKPKKKRAPVAAFTILPATGEAPLVVTFDASLSQDPDGIISQYEWNFGDEQQGNGKVITHSYMVEGSYTAALTVIDDDGLTNVSHCTIAVERVKQPPVASFALTPATGEAPLEVCFDASASMDPDGLIAQYHWDFGDGQQGTGVTTAHTYPTPGAYTITLTVTDNDGLAIADHHEITIERTKQTPTAVFSLDPATGQAPLEVTFDASASTDPDGTIVQYTWDFGDEQQGTGVTATHTYDNEGSYTITLTVTDNDGLTHTGSQDIMVESNLGTVVPPDPQTVAPTLDQTIVTSLAAATEFLYSGNQPIQTGVAPGTMNPIRVAVIRGRVLDRENKPLPGVSITVLNHPEFGQTLSRRDGMFDLAVNGGGLLTLNYAKDGYLPAQRQVRTPWQDYVWAPDVVLIPLDPVVTLLDLNQTSEAFVVARGSEVAENDDRRQATLLFPQGVQAEMVYPNGSTQTLGTLHVRATEYTIGNKGPQTMPAALPPTSGYTYAVEISADEALAAGASDVRFDQPLYFYVEDFIGFPVGSPVPVGYYDRQKGQWIPSQNGRVIKILSLSNGLADLDADGDGLADETAKLEALGLGEAERAKLAALYPQTPKQVWRVPITHFTPWDCNWPYGPPDDAVPPHQAEPDLDQTEDEGCETSGSIIEVQNQVLGERLPLTGTPLTLNYHSDRTPGRQAANTLNIPLSGATIPANLSQIQLEIQIAGRQFKQAFSPQPNLSHTFTWDQKDAYGRTLQGNQPVTVRIGYTYPAVYREPGQFEQSFGSYGMILITGNRARQDITIWQEWQGVIGPWEAKAQGLGGWVLNAHHSYNPLDRTIYLGDGSRRSVKSLGQVVTVFAGKPSSSGYSGGDGGPATEARIMDPWDVACGPDGSVYVSEHGGSRIRRIDPNGIITTVVGTGSRGHSGDGGPATQAQIYTPMGIDIGQDGSVFFVENGGTDYIRRIGSDGVMSTVAGSEQGGYGVGGELATQVQLKNPEGVAVGPDGSLYFLEANFARVRRIDPNGIITTVAGNGNPGFSGDGGPATQAQLIQPCGVAVGLDGSLYIADGNLIRRVGPDGIISTIAGRGSDAGDGVLATKARLYHPRSVTVASDGSLYIGEVGFLRRVRRIDPSGIITTVAGGKNLPFDGFGRPATDTVIRNPNGCCLGLNSELYFVDREFSTVLQLKPVLPGLSLDDIVTPSEDGSELYVFDKNGRHLRTVNTLTGTTIYEFKYDAQGYLIEITDGNGNLTTIERNTQGQPTAIVAPFGQRTELQLNGDGYLEQIKDPAGQAYHFTYLAGGLLETITDPRGNTSHYSYDNLGRLIKAEDPAKGVKELLRSGSQRDRTVRLITRLLRETAYRIEHLPTGEARWETTCCGGTKTVMQTRLDGSRTLTYPDGMVTTLRQGPDPRFGMQAPLVESLTTRMPGGLNATVTMKREATLGKPNVPLSLKSQKDTITVNGRTYTTVFDATTRQMIAATPEGRKIEATLDEQGRIVLEQLADLEPIRYTYDQKGRLVVLTQGSGVEVREFLLAYDAAGYLTHLTDPLLRIAEFAYDAVGRVVKQTLPGGQEINYSYDANGNLTAITPPGRPAHRFEYSPVNLEETYLPPDVGAGANQTRYAYNHDRQLTEIIRPDGQTIELGYYDAGRLNLVRTPRGESHYVYNQTSGHLSALTAPDNGRLSFAYDGALLTRAAWQGVIQGSLDLSYDNNFRLASQRVNGGQPIPFSYDQDGMLTQAGSLSLSCAAQNGLIIGTTLDQTTDSRSYTGFGEMQDYRAAYNGADLFAVVYTRDKLGRISGKTETVNGHTAMYAYEYDVSGRLTGVKKNQTPIAAYTYDSNGNRLSYTDSAGTVSGQYDDQDRLLQYGQIRYEYTANGELQCKIEPSGETRYHYDVLGNLMGVTLPDGTEIEYLIDGLNRRIGKKVNAQLVQGWLYQDRLNPIAELDGSGQVVARFIYGSKPNVPDYIEKAGQTYRLISDHLGSPRLVLDAATGSVVQQLDYDAFGNVLNDTNPGFQPFGFAGGIYDTHTKLIRFGVRDYEPDLGRWLEKDSLKFTGGSGNFYDYVLNEPINRQDSTGLSNIMDILTIIGALQGVMAIPPAIFGPVSALPEAIVIEAGGPTVSAAFPSILAGSVSLAGVLGAGLIGVAAGWWLVNPMINALTPKNYNLGDVLYDWLHPEDKQPAYDPLKSRKPVCNQVWSF